MSIMPPRTAQHDKAHRVPTSVYRYYDSYDVLLYVGVTSRGSARNMEHNHSKEWFRFVARQEVEHHKSRGAALNRENELIRKYKPPFNKQGNPGHDLARDAYYLFRETPRAGRLDWIGHSTGKRGSGETLPRTLWFRPGPVRDGVMRLELATTVLGSWRFGPVPKIRVKDHARKPVGHLVAADRQPDGTTTITIRVTSGPLPTGVTMSVRWPPPGGAVCQIVSLQAAYHDGLRQAEAR